MSKQMFVQACMHNSPCYEELTVETLDWNIPEEHFIGHPGPLFTLMFHISCWTSPNNPSSTDLMSVAFKHQVPAGLLIAWRAHGAHPSISNARIRMKRQQRSKHRTAMQKWEWEKLLNSKRYRKKKKDKTVTLLFFSKHELIKNGYNYRKISLQLLFRMCCRKSMVVLDWGNDPSKGVAVKIKSMQSLWTWECPSSPHSLRENCHKATYISLRNLSFQLQTPLDTFV